jgi:hypothetical protein
MHFEKGQLVTDPDDKCRWCLFAEAGCPLVSAIHAKALEMIGGYLGVYDCKIHADSRPPLSLI